MRGMKKKYKICIKIWLAEFIIVFLLDKGNIHFRSFYADIIGTLLCFLPIFVLFALMSNDKGFSPTKRTLFGLICIFMAFCYVGGVIGKFLLL